MQKYSFNITWSEADQNYVALCPAFPDLSGLGETPEAAIAELQVVLDAAIEIYQAEGWPLPGEVQSTQPSGKFALRLPKTLHARLAQRADLDGVSLNTLIVTLLAEGLGTATSQAAMQELLRKWTTSVADRVADIVAFRQHVPATRLVQRTDEQRRYASEVVSVSSEKRIVRLPHVGTRTASEPSPEARVVGSRS